MSAIRIGISLFFAATLLTFALGCAPPRPIEVTRVATSTVDGGRRPSQLDTARERGRVVCGAATSAQVLHDFDREFCRATAAALFDDATSVEIRHFDPTSLLGALRNGQIDLAFGSGATLGDGLAAAAPHVFDGLGVMTQVRGASSITELNGLGVCVAAQDEAPLRTGLVSLPIRPVISVQADFQAALSKYVDGQCVAVAGVRSSLADARADLADPHRHVVLATAFSPVPRAPLVAAGDPRWLNVVNAVVYATIEAEELGITSASISANPASVDPRARLFLGHDAGLGRSLGLSADWAVRVIRNVGNYGEIYNRTLGLDTVAGLPRGPNELWANGGLLFAPPFR